MRVTSRKSNETQDEYETRLAADARRVAVRRSNETQDERKQRLAADAERKRKKRMGETEQSRRERLAVKAERARTLRSAKSRENEVIEETQDGPSGVQELLRLQNNEERTPVSPATMAHLDKHGTVENSAPSCFRDSSNTNQRESIIEV
ncbi:unnamed protein product [Cylicostephanus goldi]|uniref:Uncharacterized protein n=1 Tax=Cylicostephanus goldi TaxID=71465 RepID=A0A3P6SU35_CYLGO|nr:unnamed protein product [Cylicostephanus goldi]